MINVQLLRGRQFFYGKVFFGSFEYGKEVLLLGESKPYKFIRLRSCLIKLLLYFLQRFKHFAFQSGVGIGTGLGSIPDEHHGDIILHILAGKLGLELNDLVVDDL
jgi:hypothetical protein